jgi:type II secretory pathway pseudopilin PulG
LSQPAISLSFGKKEKPKGLQKEIRVDKTEVKKESKISGKTKFWGIVIIIVLIVLAVWIFVVPRVKASIAKRRAAEIMTAVENLKQEVDDYWKEHDGGGGFVMSEALAAAGIKKGVQEKWQFVVAWKPTDIYTKEMMDKLNDLSDGKYVFVAPYKMIMAVATDKNPLKTGVKLWYDAKTNDYHGFGVNNKVEPDWSEIFTDPK